MSAPVKRKLTTILFADAQGYSTLMASDEAATLERLRRYRGIMAGLFERHEGREVNTWGDAVIAEFASVVEAVRCAVEIQDSLSTENSALPREKQMRFRIGINLGDVMIDGSDLYGDGVNVAERLESLAEPGGILVSGTVYDLTHKQLALAFDFAGKQEVKNGCEPIASYRVRMKERNTPEVSVGAAAAQISAPLPPQSAAGAPRPTAIGRLAATADALLAWLRHRPKRVRRAAYAIAILFLINVFTDGLSNPWFLFPSIPLGLYIYLHYRRWRAEGGETPADPESGFRGSAGPKS